MLTVGIKVRLLALCRKNIDDMIRVSGNELKSQKEASASESKSSAGDKYETGREMIRQEMDKVSRQKDRAILLRRALDLIDPERESPEVQLGSLVETDQMTYFVSAAMGKLELDGKVYYAVSPVSPIARAMFGLKDGDTFSFNGQEIKINKIS